MLSKVVVLVILWVLPNGHGGTIQVTDGGNFVDTAECWAAWEAFKVKMVENKMPLHLMAGSCVVTPFLFEDTKT